MFTWATDLWLAQARMSITPECLHHMTVPNISQHLYDCMQAQQPLKVPTFIPHFILLISCEIRDKHRQFEPLRYLDESVHTCEQGMSPDMTSQHWITDKEIEQCGNYFLIWWDFPPTSSLLGICPCSFLTSHYISSVRCGMNMDKFQCIQYLRQICSSDRLISPVYKWPMIGLKTVCCENVARKSSSLEIQSHIYIACEKCANCG